MPQSESSSAGRSSLWPLPNPGELTSDRFILHFEASRVISVHKEDTWSKFWSQVSSAHLYHANTFSVTFFLKSEHNLVKKLFHLVTINSSLETGIFLWNVLKSLDYSRTNNVVVVINFFFQNIWTKYITELILNNQLTVLVIRNHLRTCHAVIETFSLSSTWSHGYF